LVKEVDHTRQTVGLNGRVVGWASHRGAAEGRIDKLLWRKIAVGIDVVENHVWGEKYNPLAWDPEVKGTHPDSVITAAYDGCCGHVLVAQLAIVEAACTSGLPRPEAYLGGAKTRNVPDLGRTGLAKGEE